MPDDLPRKNICPLLRKPCIGLDCKWYLRLAGTDPQTGQGIDGWDCALVWQVQAMLDTRKAVTGGLDGVQKATESFRNTSAEASQTALKASIAALGLVVRGGTSLKVIHDSDG